MKFFPITQRNTEEVSQEEPSSIPCLTGTWASPDLVLIYSNLLAWTRQSHVPYSGNTVDDITPRLYVFIDKIKILNYV